MIYGYSERGIFNSIVYYLDGNEDLIGKFLKDALNIGEFSNITHSFTFLIEQSFSDFGDCDLIIIAEQISDKEKTVIFIEGKRGKSFSLENEYKKFFSKFSTSNLFIQLYFKYLLSKGNDEELIDKALEGRINKHNRKIGKNKVVLEARNKYIKDANQYYYVAIIPKEKDDAKKITQYFKKLALMTGVKNIQCASWQDIEKFFGSISNPNNDVIENFKYNKGQIYKE
ncbi:MAG: hypothetical protein FWC10_09590 [Lentimicrobiaceae bacterium]|nr:hypothetical protein [Lentimicrobiaceae bacterium]